MEAYSINKTFEEFSAAKEQFEHLIDTLTSSEMMNAPHGDIEQFLFEDGFELLRRLLQGHLDLRSAAEQPRAMIKGSDGGERTHRREGCSRPLESVFGEVTVTRFKYSYPGYDSIFPLDAELNLPNGKYSHGLQKLVGELAAKGSFDEAVSTLRKMTGGNVPKRQAEELAPAVAADFDAFYATRGLGEPEETDDLLIMSTDGKGIVMRQESLREVTRRAAQRAQEDEGKKRSRLKPGEKSNRKRMSTVAAVYTVAPHYRTADDVMGVRENEEEQPGKSARPRPANKRVFASVAKDPQEVISEMFAEANRRDPEHRRQWVVVVDGAKHQLNLIKSEAGRRKVAVTIVLDLIHVLEYLWDAAHAFFPVGSTAAEDWVSEKALEILHGNAGQVAGGMRRKATMLGIAKSKRANIDKCADYLLKYKKHLGYKEYLDAGLPIASGVIEGACRYLVKDRMDLTGARWGLEGAEAVLKLRALRVSGDFEDYWEFHKAEEFKRHHRSRYVHYPRLEVVK